VDGPNDTLFALLLFLQVLFSTLHQDKVMECVFASTFFPFCVPGIGVNNPINGWLPHRCLPGSLSILMLVMARCIDHKLRDDSPSTLSCLAVWDISNWRIKHR
jgi:hypothetical protein